VPCRKVDHGRERDETDGPRVILQVSAFNWGEDPGGWLVDLARTATSWASPVWP
jgi:hypothetical protein